MLCRFLDIGAVTKNHLLKYALAHAFCCFLASVEDVNPAVATRARLLLDTIKRPALQVTFGLCLIVDVNVIGHKRLREPPDKRTVI